MVKIEIPHRCEACGRETDDLELCEECSSLTCENCTKLAENQDVECLYCWKEVPPGEKK